MDSMKGQGGIQILLTAEQEAQQIISNARSTKLARLKQAREEADSESACYRAQVDDEYQKKISESSGFSGLNVNRLEEETNGKIQHMKNTTLNISSDVVGMIIKYVMTVRT